MTFSTVSVIGLGYIGLPTAAVMAERGMTIVGVDVNLHAVETINRGEIHIVEPLLDLTVKAAVASGRLRAVTSPVAADAFLIAVPTPITTDKKADMSYVLAAADAIAPVLKRGDLVILESTSPVGATEMLVARFAQARKDLRFPARGDDGAEVDVNIAYCPERVLPGRVVEELVSNDRAIGGMTPVCTRRAAELYGRFVEGDLVETDARSAELCKLAENAFRDVNIAYANELANVCDGLDMDVWEVIRLANRHPRVNILNPGPGVGGHCIAVDPWFIAEAAPKDTPVIQAARRVNDDRPHRVAAQITAAARKVAGARGAPPTIALLGLAFKPDIDDLRESPAVEVAGLVRGADLGRVLVVEPNITRLPAALGEHGVVLTDLAAALAEADIIVLLVDHREFREIGSAALANRVIVDTRGLWSR
jgi:UDP-N-acetyl-D-mannosaminuronic acid dehydrogenase